MSGDAPPGRPPMCDDWRISPGTYAAEREVAAHTPPPTRWETAEQSGATTDDLKD